MRLNRILLVDDEPDIRMVAGLSLRKIGGYEVLDAESGPEGLCIAESNSPDLIILDVMMPEMDGLTTLRKLRENPNTCNIPIIFMTARVQKTEIELYMKSGAIGVIEKPFDPMSISARVAAIASSIAA